MSGKATGNDWRDEVWKQAVGWYGLEALPTLRAMTRAQLLAMMQEVNEHSMREPLHLCHGAQFVVPLWSEKPLTGGQCTALLVFGLWVVQGESEEMASGLMDDWGQVITQACFLARNDDGTKQVGVYMPPASKQPAAQGDLFGQDMEGAETDGKSRQRERATAAILHAVPVRRGRADGDARPGRGRARKKLPRR